MLAKIEKEPLGVMDMGSDEEDCTVVDKGNTSNKTPLQSKLQTPVQQQQQSSIEATTTSIVPEDDFRSFWKAGSYAVEPTNKFAPAGELLEHARVHPKFLHSNATSHKWAFGAIAELLDNAVDEIPKGATFVKVDKIDLKKDNSPALVFHDDGGGMDPESLRKCMSLGYSSKKGSTTIGQYGNGFKTSTMRLGADVIVLSRANRGGKATQSVGLLSYTFLRTTGQDDVIVPMIDFDITSSWAEPIIYSSQDDWSSNLKTILEWSPFSSKDELMVQFEDIGNHGTKVIIYNLWLNDEGIYELSFDDDEEDIQLRDESSRGGSKKLNKKTVELQRHISYRIRYSLRAYASMLYLRKFTNFSIILRGVQVQQFNIADELKNSEVVTYKPQTAAASKEAVVETTIGFIKEAPTLGVCGFNIYHKNRLIRSFWKVVPEGSSRGHGVVGVLEANFIEPTHDKQDFERSALFMRLETRLKQMVMDYWKTHCHLIGYQSPMDRALKIQNVGAVPPSRGNTQPVELSPDQNYGGLSASSLGSMRLDRAMVGLPAADVQSFNRAQYGRTYGADVQKDLPAGSYEVVLPMNDSEPLSVNQLCEDNVQLFMRCEEHKQRHTALKQMITGLEKELEEAKAKCSHLSSFMLLKGFQNQ